MSKAITVNRQFIETVWARRALYALSPRLPETPKGEARLRNRGVDLGQLNVRELPLQARKDLMQVLSSAHPARALEILCEQGFEITTSDFFLPEAFPPSTLTLMRIALASTYRDLFGLEGFISRTVDAEEPKGEGIIGRLKANARGAVDFNLKEISRKIRDGSGDKRFQYYGALFAFRYTFDLAAIITAVWGLPGTHSGVIDWLRDSDFFLSSEHYDAWEAGLSALAATAAYGPGRFIDWKESGIFGKSFYILGFGVGRLLSFSALFCINTAVNILLPLALSPLFFARKYARLRLFEMTDHRLEERAADIQRLLFKDTIAAQQLVCRWLENDRINRAQLFFSRWLEEARDPAFFVRSFTAAQLQTLLPGLSTAQQATVLAAMESAAEAAQLYVNQYRDNIKTEEGTQSSPPPQPGTGQVLIATQATVSAAEVLFHLVESSHETRAAALVATLPAYKAAQVMPMVDDAAAVKLLNAIPRPQLIAEMLTQAPPNNAILRSALWALLRQMDTARAVDVLCAIQDDVLLRARFVDLMDDELRIGLLSKLPPRRAGHFLDAAGFMDMPLINISSPKPGRSRSLASSLGPTTTMRDIAINLDAVTAARIIPHIPTFENKKKFLLYFPLRYVVPGTGTFTTIGPVMTTRPAIFMHYQSREAVAIILECGMVDELEETMPTEGWCALLNHFRSIGLIDEFTPYLRNLLGKDPARRRAILAGVNPTQLAPAISAALETPVTPEGTAADPLLAALFELEGQPLAKITAILRSPDQRANFLRRMPEDKLQATLRLLPVDTVIEIFVPLAADWERLVNAGGLELFKKLPPERKAWAANAVTLPQSIQLLAELTADPTQTEELQRCFVAMELPRLLEIFNLAKSSSDDPLGTMICSWAREARQFGRVLNLMPAADILALYRRYPTLYDEGRGSEIAAAVGEIEDLKVAEIFILLASTGPYVPLRCPHRKITTVCQTLHDSSDQRLGTFFCLWGEDTQKDTLAAVTAPTAAHILDTVTAQRRHALFPQLTVGRAAELLPDMHTKNGLILEAPAEFMGSVLGALPSQKQLSVTREARADRPAMARLAAIVPPDFDSRDIRREFAGWFRTLDTNDGDLFPALAQARHPFVLKNVAVHPEAPAAEQAAALEQMPYLTTYYEGRRVRLISTETGSQVMISEYILPATAFEEMLLEDFVPGGRRYSEETTSPEYRFAEALAEGSAGADYLAGIPNPHFQSFALTLLPYFYQPIAAAGTTGVQAIFEPMATPFRRLPAEKIPAATLLMQAVFAQPGITSTNIAEDACALLAFATQSDVAQIEIAAVLLPIFVRDRHSYAAGLQSYQQFQSLPPEQISTGLIPDLSRWLHAGLTDSALAVMFLSDAAVHPHNHRLLTAHGEVNQYLEEEGD